MRLIDADALKEDIKKYTSVFARYDWREICEMLNDAPTVDAVEVVRCKDCKWRGKVGCAVWIGDERDIPETIKPPQGVEYLAKQDDDFCSWGERKDETN